MSNELLGYAKPAWVRCYVGPLLPMRRERARHFVGLLERAKHVKLADIEPDPRREKGKEEEIVGNESSDQ